MLLEPVVELGFDVVMPDALEAALGLGDGAVEVGHRLFRRGDLGGIGEQQVAALDGAEIRGEIVEVAEHAGIGQPYFGDVGGQPVEIAQPPDAEEAQHQDQQEEQQKHRREVEADRMRLPRGRQPSANEQDRGPQVQPLSREYR